MEPIFVEGKNKYGPIIIIAENLGEAWEKAVIAVIKGGYPKFVQAPDYQTNTRECQMFLHIKNPLAEPRLHPNSVLDRSTTEEYTRNFIHGMADSQKENQHDYSYYGRLRCYPDCEVRADWPNVAKQEQTQEIVNKLSGGRCIVRLMDQVQMAIDTFKRDQTRRSVVLHTWIPMRDLDKFSPKREKSSSPCLTQIQPQINDGKLHFNVIMKTNDLFNAWPENAFAFTALQKWMAEQIGVAAGHYTHYSISMQIYEDMFPMAEELANNPVLTKIEV